MRFLEPLTAKGNSVLAMVAKPPRKPSGYVILGLTIILLFNMLYCKASLFSQAFLLLQLIVCCYCYVTDIGC